MALAVFDNERGEPHHVRESGVGISVDVPHRGAASLI